MRTVLIAVLFIAYYSAFAQDIKYYDANSKTLIFRDPPSAKDKPLILIDGKAYNGKLEDIDQQNIASLSVIKKESAISIYGKKAAAGVIMITTSRALQPQPDDIYFPPPLRKGLNNIMLNGKATKMLDENIDRLDVLDMTVVKVPQKVGGKRTSERYHIITTPYAIKEYQKKFASFSAGYKAYVDTCKSLTDSVLYIVNGTPLDRQNLFSKKQLYNIPVESIKSVDFFEKFYRSILNNINPILVITTKKP